MLKELNDFFRAMVLAMLGIAPKSKQGQNFVRFTWPADGQPAWKIDEDVCFASIVPVDSDMERQRNYSYDGKNELQKDYRTRELLLSLVFYGPNSWEYAYLIRNKVLHPCWVEQFRINKLGLISDSLSLTRVPELYNKQWWERCDLTMGIYQYTEDTFAQPAFASAEVVVITD